MNSPVQEIKERLPIVDVISPYVKLERSGIHLRGRCPFHNEKTPSFFVSPERNTFHCFGCGKGGDVFSFTQDIEGLSFKETLIMLADRAGVKLEKNFPTKNEGEKENNDSIHRALELATKYYQAVLPKFPNALAYIHSRGISDLSITNFRIGYAPEGWRNLSILLSSKGISEEVQEKAGLVIRNVKSGGENAYYDRFRGRVMFPIANPQGKIVGFSGRVFPENKNDTTAAKYVNSPETPVYNKSRILFGYDKAKQAIARAKRAVLVEGQMDLVMSHQSGVEETVAVSGTALTAYHLSLIKRFTHNIVLAFDADSAGFKAAERAVGLAFDADMDVSVVRMAKGMDPADIARADESAWRELLKHPKHFIEMYIDVLREEFADDRVFKKEVGVRVLPYVAKIKSSIDRSHFVAMIARRLSVREETVLEDLQKISAATENTAYKEHVNFSKEAKDRKKEITKILFSIALWQKDKNTEFYENIMNELRQRLKGETETDLPAEEEYNHLIFEAELGYRDRDLENETKDLLRNLDQEISKENLKRLTEELHNAEREKENDKVKELLRDIQKEKKNLESLLVESQS